MSYSSGLYFSVPTRISHYLEESNSFKASKLILWVPSFWSIPKWKDHSVVFCISNRNKYWKFFLQLYNLNIIHNSKMIALYLIFLGNNNNRYSNMILMPKRRIHTSTVQNHRSLPSLPFQMTSRQSGQHSF